MLVLVLLLVLVLVLVFVVFFVSFFPLGEVLVSVEKVMEKKSTCVISHRSHGKVSPLPTTFLFPVGSVLGNLAQHSPL